MRNLIQKNGFLPQDAEQRDQSWLDTYGMVETLMNDFPDFLPNTYDQYGRDIVDFIQLIGRVGENQVEFPSF